MFGRRRRERSPSGAAVLRHAPVDRPFQGAAGGEAAVHAAVEAHFEEHLGPPIAVWHELISDLVHIDVLMWEPTDERPMHVFATLGMSDLPMTLEVPATVASTSSASWPCTRTR